MWNKEDEKLLFDLLTDMIRINSSNPPGREREVAEYIQNFFNETGIESRIYEKAEGRSNIWAMLPGGEGQPILFLSHIDVVPAPDVDDWKRPPFEAVCDNGVLYGRGALDTKHLTAMQLVAMVKLKKSGKPLDCPVIFLASADEEGGSGFGMDFISSQHPELLPPGYVISEGGGFVIEQDGKKYRTCTCGEKGACRMTMTARAGEGQSFFDYKGSAAYSLFTALDSIGSYTPPEQESSVSQAFRKVTGGVLTDKTMKNLWQYSSKSSLTITGYDKQFTGEEAETSMPLVYNFIHGTQREEIEALMDRLLSGLEAGYVVEDISQGYESTIDCPFVKRLQEVSQKYDPETQMLPMIALGRTDGRFIRNNVYGYSPMLSDLPFSQVLKKVHQKDECITEASLYYGGKVLYETAALQTGLL